MGMDVYGIHPDAKAGEYFRNNWWWWLPLWTYAEQVAPSLTKKVKYAQSAQSNDGDGLKTKKDCIALAEKLETAVADQIPFQRPAQLDGKDEQGEKYPFDYDNVLSFCMFLRHCGGFKLY